MSETPLKSLGKYQIRKELGKGAMGVVYLGFDPGLEREVALKVMASAIVSDKELKERFEKEAKAVARLQHPNIVTVYDLGYDDQGAPFIAMEYLKGQDLEARIRRNPLTFREKLNVVAQTCRGLAAAHREGIVHRDIKPANIFITESGDAKIMDFGVARWQKSSHTQTGAVLGTADYMSPEQIKGQKVDGRSDIFSAGVILYRLLTNKKPFSGENIQAVFFKVLNQPPPELVLPEGNEMPELQAIVDKALSKDCDDRYATADDLADDIKDLLSLYQDLLNEDTVFDTMFDPATVTGEMDTGSDGTGTGRRRGATTGTGRILGGTTSGGISRTHRPGTAYTTAAGRTGAGRTVAGRTVVAPTRMMGPSGRTMGGTRPGVGIPIEQGGGWWKYVGVVVLLLAVAGGVYFVTERANPGGGEAVTDVVQPPPPPAPTIDERIETARNALAMELFSKASTEVDDILFEHPDNEAAIALKKEIDEAQRKAQGSVDEGPKPKPPPPGPTPAQQRVAELAVDASMAIGDGELDRAETLIAEGRRLDAANERWPQLTDQLRRERDKVKQAQAAQEKADVIEAYVTRAAELMRNKDYKAAIAVYDEALKIDPTNANLIASRNLAQDTLVRDVSTLEIKQSVTKFFGPEGGGGFEDDKNINVKLGTQKPDGPAEVTIEIFPITVQPGQPYYLRVRVFNKGNKPIGIKGLQLISTFGAKTSGKGQELAPMVQRVNPRDTSLIWEVQGNWTEDQNQGKVEAIVHLIGKARLEKAIWWQ
jgi:predicted Ser/Thr protein kinase